MKKKINIYKKIFFLVVILCFFSCGRKGMPFVPDQPVLDKPSDIVIKKQDKKIEVLWGYKGDADFFSIGLAFIKCSGCPDTFVNLGNVSGDKRFFFFTVKSEGDYKLRITAVKKKNSSEPEYKKFSVK